MNTEAVVRLHFPFFGLWNARTFWGIKREVLKLNPSHNNGYRTCLAQVDLDNEHESVVFSLLSFHFRFNECGCVGVRGHQALGFAVFIIIFDALLNDAYLILARIEWF